MTLLDNKWERTGKALVTALDRRIMKLGSGNLMGTRVGGPRVRSIISE